MRSVRRLTSDPRYEVSAVTCDAQHARWDEPEPRTQFGIVLVRKGRFRRRVRGVVIDADATLGYLMAPGDEEQFAHPGGGDDCTHITIADSEWRQMTHTDWPARQSFAIDPPLHLAHRRLAAAARGGDAHGLAERLLHLLALAIERSGQRLARGEPTPSDSAVVAASRDRLQADPAGAPGLFDLAEELGVSPYRLSRAFPRELGVTLTSYRNALRISRALDRIEAGEQDLSALAADLGFADHAHFTRTMRRHLGHSPSALRHALAAT
jgi:AraC-like DNA-binding protein